MAIECHMFACRNALIQHHELFILENLAEDIHIFSLFWQSVSGVDSQKFI